MRVGPCSSFLLAHRFEVSCLRFLAFEPCLWFCRCPMNMNFRLMGASLWAVLAIANVARGADAPAAAGFKFATIEMPKVLQSVEAGKKAKAQLEKEFKTKKKMFDDEDAAIKKLFDEYKKQQLALSDEAKAKKEQEINERGAKLQESAQKSQAELQKREQELTAPLVKNVRDLAKEMAEKQGYQAVVDRNEAFFIYSSDSIDLTDQLIKAYNGKFK